VKVKAIVLHHNKPENAEKLFFLLLSAFDDVEVWDSGSDPDKLPKCPYVGFPNIYWTGAWNEAMARYRDRYGAVWILGCDIDLLHHVGAYRAAIESAMPFGCWSPCIQGRAHPFMLHERYGGKPRSVKNVEGMAMACSGQLMREVVRLVDGSPLGYGQDFWFCHRARKMGLRNVIDGRVRIYHPPGRGYDDGEALVQMERAFGRIGGPNFRQTIFEYSEFFDGNLLEANKEDAGMFKIVTVDNGWGVPEFVRIARQIEGATKVIMRKGISRLEVEKGFEIVDYDETLANVLNADVAIFTRVGAANKDDFKRLHEAGIPCVVNVSFHQGAIEHEKNGFVYGTEDWAVRWVNALRDSEELRRKVSNAAKGVEKAARPPVVDLSKVAPPVPVPQKLAPMAEVKRDEAPRPKVAAPAPRVSVITPTYRRHPEIVRRCIDCMLLQTMQDWEQIVCSDGNEEEEIKALVSSVGDRRVSYCCSGNPKREGDFGNTVRRDLLAMVRGELVLFFDDDNVILPSYLEVMTKAVETSGKDFAVCRVIHFGPLNESVVGRPPAVLKCEPVRLYFVDPLQFLVRTKAMRDIGWDVKHGYSSDGHTLEMLGAKYKHVIVEEVLGVHM
jgi:hypothetical protein